MKYLLTILTLLTFNLAVGQNVLLDKYANRQFDSLSSEKEITDLEAKFNLKFRSISSCINPLTSNYLNDNEAKVICKRLEEISTILHSELSPIIISIGGMNNVEHSEELNKKGNKFNVVFVAFGNGCVLDKRDKEFENAFNGQTLKLLNISTIDKIVK